MPRKKLDVFWDLIVQSLNKKTLHFIVQDHLDPVEDARKIEKMEESINPDRQAVVHLQDQGQGALADGRDDVLHLLGQGRE